MDNQKDLTMTSAPVDPENPGFDSLLGALKGFHEGEYGKDVLEKYHTSLQSHLNESKSFIQDMEIHEETRETRDKALGSLGMVQMMLDSLKAYIESPNPDTLASCVQSLLDARASAAYVHSILDENIKAMNG